MNKDISKTEQNQDEQLDAALAQLAEQPAVAPSYLASRIVANLPDQEPLDRVLDWLSSALWRGAAVAAVPLLLGFALGSANMAETETWEEAEALVYVDTITEYDNDEI